jgi:hypothetical protein
MSAAIKELEEKRTYLLGRIEYLEASIEKYKTNEGELEEDFSMNRLIFMNTALQGIELNYNWLNLNWQL